MAGLQKNVSGQNVLVYAYEDGGGSTAGSPVTGDAANITAQVRQDSGTLAATNTTNPTEVDSTNAPGYYEFPLTQAETNGDTVDLFPVSSTANVQVQTSDYSRYTSPANHPDIGIESDGHVHGDIKEWLGSAPNALSSGNVQGDIQQVAGTGSNATVLGDWLGAFVNSSTGSISSTSGTNTINGVASGDQTKMSVGDLFIYTSGALAGFAYVITGKDSGTETLTVYPALQDSPTGTDNYLVMPMQIANVAGKVIGNDPHTDTIQGAGTWSLDHNGNNLLSTNNVNVSGGIVESNLQQVNGNTTVASRIVDLYNPMQNGTVDAGTFTPTATQFETSGLSDSSDDTYVGTEVYWGNSAPNQIAGRGYLVVASEGTTNNTNNKVKLTIQSLPIIPTGAEPFVMLPTGNAAVDSNTSRHSVNADAISESTTAADNLESNISNLDAAITSRLAASSAPTNWSSMSITAGGYVSLNLSDVTGTLGNASVGWVNGSGEVTVGTNNDKAGYSLSASQSFDNTGQSTNLPSDMQAILGTAITETNAGDVADNVSQFFDVEPTTSQTVDDVGSGGGGSFWSTSEQEEIRYRLQVDGTQTAPSTDAPTQMPVDAQKVNGQDAETVVQASGSGATSHTLTFKDNNGNPIADADVWVTSDATGTNVVAGTLQTDSNGQTTFDLDNGITYYAWMQKDGFNSVRGDSFTV